jgi:hypothetical protein
MGVVYEARQTGLNRAVAVKMLLDGGHAGPRGAIRFLAEAEAVAAARHPHVVQVFEFGDHDGRPFLVMEHLPGGSLADRLRTGHLSPEAAARLVSDVADAVDAVHREGIVHRDLKPANVLFDAAGEPKVSDFGLAKRGAADLTRTGAVMGTPAYMAPEQAKGGTKFVGPPADVYALGVILFECLTGKRPFDDDDPVALIMKVAQDDPPAVREFAPDAPWELEAVVRRCLAKDPEHRYQSAAELAADLRAWLAGDTPDAARTSPFASLWSTLDRGTQAVEFAAYAGIFLWLAPVVLCAEVLIWLAANEHLDHRLVPVIQYGRLAAILAVVWVFRRGRLLPRTAPERQLWSLWGGYLLTCLFTGLSHRAVYGWHGAVEFRLYQSLALLTALAYFALGATFWGWFYAFGLAFLGLSVAMAADLTYAPLGFGGLWAVVLLVFWRYLRRRVPRVTSE